MNLDRFRFPALASGCQHEVRSSRTQAVLHAFVHAVVVCLEVHLLEAQKMVPNARRVQVRERLAFQGRHGELSVFEFGQTVAFT